MEFWLNFTDSSLEKDYEKYVQTNTERERKFYFYIIFSYGIMTFLATLIDYFLNPNIQEENEDRELFIKIAMILAGCITFGGIYFIDKKCSFVSNKQKEIIKLVLVLF